MNIIILFCYLLPIFALKGEPKLCINCKSFKKDFFSDNQFGKCSLFQKESYSINYLVDGKRTIPKNEYYYCSTARGSDDMCGKDGLLFEKKRKTKK